MANGTKQIFKVPEHIAYVSFDTRIHVVDDSEPLGYAIDGRKLSIERAGGKIVGFVIE